MKRILFFLVILYTTNVFSQNNFKKGYFINENGNRTECLIYDQGWRNNPTSFQYKLSENSDTKKASIDRIQEFGINDGDVFIRATVDMDRSSKQVDDLSDTRNPIFKEEQLFLKVLVKGKASLYSYQENSLFRYFFETESIEITQLIYKKFTYSTIDGIYREDNKIGENNQFRQQLFDVLKCDEISKEYYEKIKYRKNDLTKFFVKYNQCENADYTKAKRKKADLDLTIRPGISMVPDLEIINILNPSRNVTLEVGPLFRIGLEAEVILPINNNKWSVFVEPTYRTYSADKNYDNPTTVSDDRVEVEYTSIELPVGARHYFFLGDKFKIFLNASALFEVQLDSKIAHFSSQPIQLPISNYMGFTFGGGVKYSDFSLELRYMPPRNLLSVTTNFYKADYSSFSIIVGYTIF